MRVGRSGLFQSVLEAGYRYADYPVALVTDDNVVLQDLAVRCGNWQAEADVKHVRPLIIVHVQLLYLGNAQNRLGHSFSLRPRSLTSDVRNAVIINPSLPDSLVFGDLRIMESLHQDTRNPVPSPMTPNHRILIHKREILCNA